MSVIDAVKSKFSNKPVVPVVRLEGVIGPDTRMKDGLNIENVGEILEKAFSNKNALSVAVIVNSPGGSPAQSELIHDHIQDLANIHKKKVDVFVEDVAASGGYWIACAGDSINVLKTSVVGSIGVIAGGFGFVDAIKKLGVARRVYTAGKSKSMLDPFKEEKPEDLERLDKQLNQMHKLFIEHVKNRRQGKLTASDVLEAVDDIFTGEVWLGDEAKKIGLVDNIGTVSQVMKEKYGKDVKLVPVKQQKPFLKGLMGLGQIRSSSVAQAVESMISSSGHWGRFGL